MDNKQLLNAMGDIADDIVKEADPAHAIPRRSMAWRTWVAVAACLAILAAALFPLLRNQPEPDVIEKPAPVYYSGFEEIATVLPTVTFWELDGRFYFSAYTDETPGAGYCQPLFQYNPADGSCVRLSDDNTVMHSMYNGRFYYAKYADLIAHAQNEETPVPTYSNSPNWDDEQKEEQSWDQFAANATLVDENGSPVSTVYRGFTDDTHEPYTVTRRLEDDTELTLTVGEQTHIIPYDLATLLDDPRQTYGLTDVLGVSGGRVYLLQSYRTDSVLIANDVFSIRFDGSDFRRHTDALVNGGINTAVLRDGVVYYAAWPGDGLSRLIRHDLAADDTTVLCTVKGSINALACSDAYIVYDIHDQDTNTATLNAYSLSDTALYSELTAFLNDESHNGFVGTLNTYTRVTGINLYFVFSEGAGISRSYDELNAEEQQAVGAVKNEFMPCWVFKKTDMEAYLQKMAGISLADVTRGTRGLTYVEAHDLYFLQHTDTNYQAIKISNVTTDADGNYAVTYVDDYLGAYVVTLAKTDDGYRFLSNMKSVPYPEITTFLNDVRNNGFVGLNTYTRPQDISLYMALYDYAGIERYVGELSAEEQRAVKQSPNYTEEAPCYVFRKADIEALLRAKADISLSDLTGGTQGLTYVEEYDLYFIQHNDTHSQTVEISNVTTDADGNYAVTYAISGLGTYVVTLAESDDGYRFLSNVQEDL